MENEVLALEVGDKIRVRNKWGIWHYGVYIGPQGWLQRDVIHNDKQGGVQLTHYAVFATGRRVELVSRPSADKAQKEKITARALELIGKKYEVFNFNCEHFANYAQNGVAHSVQLRWASGAGLAVAVAGLVWLAFAKKPTAVKVQSS